MSCRIRPSYMQVWGILLFSVYTLAWEEERHYVLHSRLPRDEVLALVSKEGGRIHKRIEILDAYHVILPGKTLEEGVNSDGEVIREERLDERGLHNHPEVKLVYQEPHRIEKRATSFYDRKPEWDDFGARSHPKEEKPKKMKLPSDEEYERQYKELAKIMQGLVPFNDPGSKYAWQHLNTGNYSSSVVGNDLNIYPAYVYGFTGHGSKVVILDDGVDHWHDDLRANYDPSISGNVIDPQPWQDDPRGPYPVMRPEDGHGTMCAGLVAAVSNNGLCSHGIAYNAKIGGVRLLAGPVNDVLEGSSMLVNAEETDIMCASWGPTDDGRTLDKPRQYTTQAFLHGDEHGRRGLGTFFVFASGNGGYQGDNCGADGFTSSPYVIAITALDANGARAIYTESCSAIRVAIPVGTIHIDQFGQRDLLPTTAENNNCVDSFVGTSAAAPLAAGCFALVLEARPQLSKRDFENILPWSARLPNPIDTDWWVSSAGVLSSSHSGYGLLDCTRMIFLAGLWKEVGPLCVKVVKFGQRQSDDWSKNQASVPGRGNYFQVSTQQELQNYRQKLLQLHKEQPRSMLLFANSSLELPVTPDSRIGHMKHSSGTCHLETVEKVVVRYQLSHICRGSLQLKLRSPSGTISTLLYRRPLDQSTGEIDINITSTAHWGEPFDHGTWHLLIHTGDHCPNDFLNPFQGLAGIAVFVELTAYGTTVKGSAFERNKDILFPFLPRISRLAIEAGRSHKLSVKEVAETFDEQRWLALNFSRTLVKRKFPEKFPRNE